VRPLRLIIADEAGFSSGPEARPADVQTWRDAEGAVLARCRRQGDRHRVDVPGLASYSFDLGGDIVLATLCPAASKDAVRPRYESLVVPLLLQALGTEVLHASAVRGPHGVMAFCGDSGAGKSTIAFGLGRRGYSLWADDAVAVDPEGAAVSALPLPFAIHLRPPSAAHFGFESHASRMRVTEGEALPSRSPAPLSALLLLEQTGTAGVTVERVSPSSAFPRLLGHAYCFSLQDAERKRRMIERYLDLAARVPIFELRFQAGLDHLDKMLDALEEIMTGKRAT
jgi:hypothetical protein